MELGSTTPGAVRDNAKYWEGYAAAIEALVTVYVEEGGAPFLIDALEAAARDHSAVAHVKLRDYLFHKYV